MLPIASKTITKIPKKGVSKKILSDLNKEDKPNKENLKPIPSTLKL